MNNLYPEFFRRQDERPDALFYQRPQRESHLDREAAARTARLYDDLLPHDGLILDLMAGSDSHLPRRSRRVVGLGLDRAELASNPVMDELVIHDLNLEPELPFHDGEFDGAVCTVSVQYMTRPQDTFAEVARSLRRGAPFIVTFSRRMYAAKAVLAWRSSDDAAHVRLVRSYFDRTAGFGATMSRQYVPGSGDPLYAVWACRNPAYQPGPAG